MMDWLLGVVWTTAQVMTGTVIFFMLLYLAARLIFAAYFRTKADFIKKGTTHGIHLPEA